MGVDDITDTEAERHWWRRSETYVCLVAILLILVSVAIYHWEIFEHFSHDKNMKHDDVVKDIYSPFFMSSHFYASFLRELGFAGIVAVVVSLTIERAAKDRQVREVRSQLEKVNKGVFEAVLKRNLPPPIIDKVFDTILNKEVIRNQSNIQFKFAELPDDAPEGRENYLLLYVSHSYTIENVSNQSHRFPLRMFSPKPCNMDFAEYVDMPTVTVAGTQLSDEEMEHGEEEIADLGFERRFLHPVPIMPGQSIAIRTTTCLLKERSDNELFTSLVSTEKMEVEVEFALSEQLSWHVDAIHDAKALQPTDVRAPTPPYSVPKLSFRPTGVILPYQGIIIWWRPLENSGTVHAGELDAITDGATDGAGGTTDGAGGTGSIANEAVEK